MTVFEETVRDVLIAVGLLLTPVGVAVVWAMVNGLRAEIRERRALRLRGTRGTRIATPVCALARNDRQRYGR